MRRHTTLSLTLALAVPALVACAGSAAEPETSTAGVPEGVTEQYETLAAEVAERGGSTTSGEWEVSYIVEAAEPWFEQRGGSQELRPPAEGETHHIEIIPTEAATGRVVPDVPVTLEVLDESGEVVASEELAFYASTFFHYAENFEIPEEGNYTLRATLDAPDFRRHGEEGEQPALTEDVTVTFEDVALTRD